MSVRLELACLCDNCVCIVLGARPGGGWVSRGWDANFVLLLIVCVDTEQFVVKIYGSIKID